ncbi:MAG: hypothetical protein IPM77_03230 [Crocinitomicaceae bacterium]|nr:hypothetical protein [Crocinitomicaceae bacterium]
MKNTDPENDYELNLGRFKNHRRVFPWSFILKVIIGLALVALVYYMTNELIKKQKQQKEEEFEIEIEL